MRLHRFEEHEGAVEVVVVVFDGFLHALAHRFETREVDDGVKRVLRKDALHCSAVADVRIVECDLFARDRFDAAERFFIGIGKIVDDYDAVAAHFFRSNIPRSGLPMPLSGTSCASPSWRARKEKSSSFVRSRRAISIWPSARVRFGRTTSRLTPAATGSHPSLPSG